MNAIPYPAKSRMRRRRSGFALVSTILLIGVAGLLLAQFSSRSVTHSLAAQKVVHELQANWSARCVQRVLFDEMERLEKPSLDSEATNEPTSLFGSKESFQLGDVVIEFIVNDESAKFDINLAYAFDENIKPMIRKFADLEDLEIDLLPKTRNRDSKDSPFVSWDQVFAKTQATDRFIQAIDGLTCWGKRVNLRTASDDALYEICKIAVGGSTAQQVVDLRGDNPAITVAEVLSEVRLAGPQKQKLRSILSDHSISQSVWMKTSHLKSGVERHTLVIREGFVMNSSASRTTARFQAFRW